jgi:hypothetical protein
MIGVATAFVFGCSLVVSTSGLATGVGGDDTGRNDSGAVEPDAGMVPGSDTDAAAGRDAAPVIPDGAKLWPANGHYYLVRAGGTSWTDADRAARALGGHLVTLNSAEENAFVYALLGAGSKGACIGAVQAPGSAEPAGGWGWVTGEPWSYANWRSSQPDNSGGNQDVAHFSENDTAGTWGDEERGTQVNGYVVEFE